MDLSDWKGVPRPERIVLEGRYARLEPLDPARHGSDLLASAREPGADDRFRYLFEDAPADMTALSPWLEKASASADPLFPNDPYLAANERIRIRSLYEGRDFLYDLVKAYAE